MWRFLAKHSSISELQASIHTALYTDLIEVLLSACFIANVKAVKFVFHSAANYAFTNNLKTMTLQSEINFQIDIAFAGNKLLT